MPLIKSHVQIETAATSGTRGTTPRCWMVAAVDALLRSSRGPLPSCRLVAFAAAALGGFLGGWYFLEWPPLISAETSAAISGFSSAAFRARGAFGCPLLREFSWPAEPAADSGEGPLGARWTSGRARIGGQTCPISAGVRLLDPHALVHCSRRSRRGPCSACRLGATAYSRRPSTWERARSPSPPAVVRAPASCCLVTAAVRARAWIAPWATPR